MHSTVVVALLSVLAGQAIALPAGGEPSILSAREPIGESKAAKKDDSEVVIGFKWFKQSAAKRMNEAGKPVITGAKTCGTDGVCDGTRAWGAGQDVFGIHQSQEPGPRLANRFGGSDGGAAGALADGWVPCGFTAVKAKLDELAVGNVPSNLQEPPPAGHRFPAHLRGKADDELSEEERAEKQRLREERRPHMEARRQQAEELIKQIFEEKYGWKGGVVGGKPYDEQLRYVPARYISPGDKPEMLRPPMVAFPQKALDSAGVKAFCFETPDAMRAAMGDENAKFAALYEARLEYGLGLKK